MIVISVTRMASSGIFAAVLGCMRAGFNLVLGVVITAVSHGGEETFLRLTRGGYSFDCFEQTCEHFTGISLYSKSVGMVPAELRRVDVDL